MALDTIDATLSRILFFEPSKQSPSGAKFLIGKTTSGGIIKGELAKPIEGERYRLYGNWVASKGYKDPAFLFTEHEVLIDESVPGVIQYLKNYVPGLGLVKASAIVEAFGVDALKVLRTDAGRALEVPGITPAIVASIEKHFRDDVKFDPVAYGKLIDLFAGHRFPRKVVKALLRDWGSDAPAKVVENPYMLLAYPRMGWKGVDAFALDPAGAAYDPAGLARQVAAIVEGLERLSDDGHTYGTRVEVEAKAFELIGRRPEDLAWDVATIDRLVVRLNDADEAPTGADGLPAWLADERPDDADEAFALPKLAAAERAIAGHLARLMGGGKTLPFRLDSPLLNDEQRAAMRVLEENPVSILAGAPGVGKAQPLDAQICTPGGFVAMGSIQVGDEVIGSDGKPCVVTEIHPQGMRQVYTVEFDDGCTVECDAHHLWTVEDRNSRRWKTVTTDYMREHPTSNDDRPRWTIPMVAPVEFAEVDLPIEPYLFGLLLGNGTFRCSTVGLSTEDPEILASAIGGLPENLSFNKYKSTQDYRITTRDHRHGENVIAARAKDLGLMGKYSYEKFIPPVYKAAHLGARIALFNGLMDTDGSTFKRIIEYSTSSPRLADDVKDLVESFGGKARISSRITHFTHKGERRRGRLSFRVYISLPPGIPAFRVSRKADLFIPRTKYPPRRRVVSITPSGMKECQCITVDAPDHLYVTDHFVVTHNSWTLAAAIGCFREHKFGTIRLMGPTGKSAKRSQELLNAAVPDHGIECSTIHRALGVAKSDDPEGVPSSGAKVGRGRDEFGFQRGPDDPLEVDLLVVEEVSMVCAKLMASLLSAVATGTRVVLVGDPNQLPSVGPGSVLRDLLAAGVPAATLATIQRSDGGGRVVRACHAIKDGVVPQPAPKVGLPAENWVHIEEDDPARIAATIVEMHESARRNGRYDPLWDMQVVSAQKKGHAFACEPLNAMLGRVLNPRAYAAGQGGEDGEEDGFGPPFRVGDKVVRTKNGAADEMVVIPELRRVNGIADLGDELAAPRVDWRWRDPRDGPTAKPRGYSLEETAVVNGDMGQVVDIVAGDGEAFAVVQFRTPDRLCRLPMGEHHLQLAYAMTAHKCVDPDTLVETTQGLLPIRAIAHEGVIGTPSGPQAYGSFVENPSGPMLKITTEDAYSITVTPDHRVEVWGGDGYEMRYAEELEIGSWVRLRFGAVVEPAYPVALPPLPGGDVRAIEWRVPGFVDEAFAEFLGLMVADGTIYRGGFRLVKRHPEVIERFAHHCRRFFGVDPKPINILGTDGYEVNSTRLVEWLTSLGGLSPNAKDVPDCILRSTASIHRAFLRGLFEDGSAHLRPNGEFDHIEWSSCFPDMIRKVKVMLLRARIISACVTSRPNRLYIYGLHALRFACEIGFISAFKQTRATTAGCTEKRYRIPVLKSEMSALRSYAGIGSFSLSMLEHAMDRQYLSRESTRILIAEDRLPKPFLATLRDRLDYHHVRITSIEPCDGPSMCVEVPEGHRFYQNGFPFGNCQGSGMPYVIVPVHNAFYWDQRTQTGLWNKELVYTAVSRAEKLLVTVGQFSAIRAAIGRPTIGHRRTRLAGYVRDAVACGGPGVGR